jgi:putative glutathione S-transferase|tara:strand:- start:299 stop:475 length:177 start_codon:yes stop_codon:yes gene_type:complete
MQMQNPDRSVEGSQTDAAARRAKGEFVRGVSRVRSALVSTAFPAEAHRYHLYVALNCP